jgi:hypothetical protein
MIDTDALERQFEKKCLGVGLVKLDEPVDTTICWHIISKVNDISRFDAYWWKPTMQEMIATIKEELDCKFYSIQLAFVNNLLHLAVSQGKGYD